MVAELGAHPCVFISTPALPWLAGHAVFLSLKVVWVGPELLVVPAKKRLCFSHLKVVGPATSYCPWTLRGTIHPVAWKEQCSWRRTWPWPLGDSREIPAWWPLVAEKSPAAQGRCCSLTHCPWPRARPRHQPSAIQNRPMKLQDGSALAEYLVGRVLCYVLTLRALVKSSLSVCWGCHA